MARLQPGVSAGRRKTALLVALLPVLAITFVWKISSVTEVDFAAYSQPVRQVVQDWSMAEQEDNSGWRSSTHLHVKDRVQRLSYPPIAAPNRSIVKARCGLTLGNWCGRYDAQKPIPARPPLLGDRPCLWSNDTSIQCNRIGVCDATMGWCHCPAGWNGDDCNTRMRRPCSQNWRQHGFEPYDEPTDPKHWGTTLACADLCDEDIAHCYCNETYAFGRIPADLRDPPGTPPKRIGRPIAHLCRRNTGWDGKKSDFGFVDTEKLYGEKGWCQAKEPEHHCPCLLDGMGGPTCETYYEAFCPNQCNGHGECNLGFCKCHAGWYGTDCAQRTVGTPWMPGMEDGERPWLKPFVHTPAARDPEPGATRKRPLIYIYDLPPLFNSILLQYRVDKHDCTHRQFNEANASFPVDHWLYQPETGVHEMLLQSEHRTLDPAEADYFYIPVYTCCLIFPILHSNDSPFFHGGPAAHRTHGATNMLMAVQNWVQTHYPYWDRNGGRDHIVLTVHDEGSCWLPAILRPAIVLSHWGRTDLNHTSDTGYGPDDYSQNITHPVWQPEGHLDKLGKFPCYDPSKDMLIPTMASPNKYSASPLLGAPTSKRHIMGFFLGRIQPDNPRYSRGVRQFLANESAVHDWWGKYKVWIGEGSPPGESSDYSKLFASSVFCLALMGDGWGARFQYAVVHGCIPVIIQDGIEMVWHSLLDIPSFTLRIEQKDMARVPEILQAVSEKEIASMQANLAKVWRRYMWTGYRPYGEQVRQMLADRRQETEAAPILSQPPPVTDYDPFQDDALSTLIQWLYSRLDDLGAHAPAPKELKSKAAQE